ncbi:hypothetical protein [Salisaeta longa]|uniref:hypothetical protein n=1 Tax=Salisaeta longa TaxID=503170 RepID=UPI0003B3BBBC|nr:hypothetical protein [Salisaeta longa]
MMHLPITRRLVALLLPLFLVVTACDSGAPTATDDFTVTSADAAEAVAAALGETTGGAIAEVEDAAGGVYHGDPSSLLTSKAFSRDCDYDDANVWWTCTVDGSVGNNLRTLSIDRTVRLQFFDASGTPQPRYQTSDGQTAESLTYTILEGAGDFEGPRLAGRYTINLNDADPSQWTVANIDSDTLSVNGQRSHARFDSLTTARTIRIRNAQASSTFEDVVFVQGSGLHSGTIQGTYAAEVERTRDGESVTRSIALEYVAEIENGQATVTITGDGVRFNGDAFTFTTNLETGDVVE